MKKMLVLVCVMAMVCSTQAVADIPANVDFHAKWSGNPGQGVFDILKNEKSYNDPCWPNHLNLFVDNQYMPDLTKLVWVEVEWLSMMNLPPEAPELELIVGGVVMPPPAVTPTASGIGWTWAWVIFPQPENEIVKFPDDGYWHLGQSEDPGKPYYKGVRSVEIGTLCVPEPVTLALLGIGGVTLLRRRR